MLLPAVRVMLGRTETNANSRLPDTPPFQLAENASTIAGADDGLQGKRVCTAAARRTFARKPATQRRQQKRRERDARSLLPGKPVPGPG